MNLRRFFGLVFMIFLVACGGKGENISAEPSPTTTLPPTATTAPTQAPPPTATATATSAPAATETLAATATATATSTPTQAPTPTQTPTPVILNSYQEIIDAGRNRFTGLLPSDPENLNRRPFFCKISNWPAEMVRPQSGLASADLVFEHMTEGPITRFSALFYGDTPPAIGPIRSARLIDLELPAMYDAALCFSGASIGVTDRLNEADFRGRLLHSWYPGYYRTGEDKPFEHTFYADPQGFWDIMTEYGINTPPLSHSQMAFSEVLPENGVSAEYVSIDYKDWTFVEWRYDADRAQWLRWADDDAFLDANSGEQIAASNVVILFAAHELDKTICEHQQDDKCYAGSTEIQLWETGDAIILRDGQRIDGYWERKGRDHMLTFHTYAGEVIPLQLGKTWFQVVAYNYRDLVQFSEPE